MRIEPGPDLRRAVPAVLAAAAEAGVLFVIVHDVAVHEGTATGGPLISYPLFLAVFVAGVGLATAFRRSLVAKLAIPVVAAAIGAAQATVWGTGDLGSVGTVEVLSLLLAFRVVAMAVRDWREPVSESFGLGTAALLVEVAVVARTDPLGGLMPIIAVVFFAGSLASRAASVWLANRPDHPAVDVPLPRSPRSAVVLIGALGVALVIAVLLGVPGGPVEISGAFLYGWAAQALAVVAAALAYLLLPLLAILAGLAHGALRPNAVARVIPKIRPDVGQGGGGAPIERIIGAVVIVLIVLLLLRAIRRQWTVLQPDDPAPDPQSEPRRDHVPRVRRRPRMPQIRRELPADTVRRWYAEALLALERLGLPKQPSRTPGEYLPEVARTFPDSARGFTALTRAYEHVRYGAVVLDRDAVRRLEVERDGAMQALGRARRVDDDPDPA
jgi:Domain of unknown function (DUF4129)